MKCAIYLEDGLTQLVLTPESEYETQTLKAILDGADRLRVMRGGFYECQGGWYRQDGSPTSYMIRIDRGNTPVE